MLQELHSDLTATIKIHSNILPREAYREKPLGGSSCSVNKRWFYPSRVLAEAVSEQRSLMDRMQEWSNKGEMCVLAKHLQSNNAPHAVSRKSLRDVERPKWSWRPRSSAKVARGVFTRFHGAMEPMPRNRSMVEPSIQRILHPHIVHPFGRTFDEDGSRNCLLMGSVERRPSQVCFGEATM